MNREAMMKAYAVLISLVLILFALFIYNKAFVGKNLSALGKVNRLIEAAAHPTDLAVTTNAAPTAPTASTQTPAQPSAADASGAPAQAAPPAAPSATPPAVASAETPTATATPAAASGDPEKGGLGSAMKNIRERSEGQRKQLENSLNPPE
ncbi:MAG: hypothetical protein HY074_07245 [Deltaproteobacteria bacterium]|nr:hypothetical protein [Deltaproteobacteria bacterium]